jgi:hypothetical protein
MLVARDRAALVRCGALLAALALGACTPLVRDTRWASVRELTPEAFAAWNAGEPGVAAGPGGRVALTWVTRDSSGRADAWIATSNDSGAHFSLALRLDARAGSVSSFSESPPVAAYGAHGELVAAWTSARDSSHSADDVVARASGDGGATFEPETFLDDDHGRPGGSTYHGFLSLDVTPQGRAIATWIDGRNAALAPGEMEPAIAQIWSAASDDDGRTWKPNVLVASSVCPCCRPALRASASGLVAVAYRGVRDTLRDPRLALSRDGGATFPSDTLLSADGWKLDACPVAGPSLTLTRDGGMVAWYTGAGAAAGHGVVDVAPWRAGAGATAPRRALADASLQAAQPRLAMLGGVTLAGVLAKREGGGHAFALETIAPDGAESAWLELGANAKSPALASADARQAYATWIEQGAAGPRLRLVRITRD